MAGQGVQRPGWFPWYRCSNPAIIIDFPPRDLFLRRRMQFVLSKVVTSQTRHPRDTA